MLKINNKEIYSEHFPNNETRVFDFEKEIFPGQNLLEFQYTDDSDLIKLLFVKQRMDEFGSDCSLAIRYMPYSRMDRKKDGNLFSLQYICRFINNLQFTRILVVEPHSEVSLELLERATPLYPVKDWLPHIMGEIGFRSDDRFVFNNKQIRNRYKDLPHVCVFEKAPVYQKGKTEEFILQEGTILPGTKCIIISDICSDGNHFFNLANQLKGMGAGEVVLIVTHCEPTVFNGKLLKTDSPICRIYTSTSMMNQLHPKIQYRDVRFACYI